MQYITGREQFVSKPTMAQPKPATQQQQIANPNPNLQEVGAQGGQPVPQVIDIDQPAQAIEPA